MNKNRPNQFLARALLLIAFAPLSVFAMGKKPPTQDALKKLYTQNYQCDVASAESRTDGKLKATLTPGAPTTVSTETPYWSSAEKPAKCIRIYLTSDTSGSSTSPSMGRCFEISEKAVEQYDDKALTLNFQPNNNAGLEIDFKSGEGRYWADYHWNWDWRHETEEAILKNCKAL
jgi:hypothetical protein